MKISAEKVGFHVANIAFAHNWKIAKKAFLNSSWFKGDKKSLQDELLVFLFFCGDFSLLFTGIKNENVLKRMRNSYIRMWQAFVRKVSPTALIKYDEHFKKYVTALHGEGKSIQTKRYEDFGSGTIGRLFLKLSGCDSMDIKLFVTETWSSTTINIVNYIREMNEKHGVI
jgi:hypothetical protein